VAVVHFLAQQVQQIIGELLVAFLLARQVLMVTMAAAVVVGCKEQQPWLVQMVAMEFQAVVAVEMLPLVLRQMLLVMAVQV
jgi:hypothetical protein